ncbi:hypothetical protein Stsp02_32560 [Streptomyces sp. NBRC 14336]|nr:hypothetical protein Stsp02_32560 [Streptomyces sp. NBRC 14336]
MGDIAQEEGSDAAGEGLPGSGWVGTPGRRHVVAFMAIKLLSPTGFPRCLIAEEMVWEMHAPVSFMNDYAD